MKMPWTRRADEAHDAAERAHRECEETKGWATRVVHELKHQREVNGWTQDILDIFGGNQ
jgi:hypothetical protein